EGLSDRLRKEVEPHGIRVIVIEPGPFRTDFAGRSLVQSENEIEAYLSTAGIRRKERSNADGTQPGDPAKAAEAIIAVVASERPPLRLLLGNSAYDRLPAELEAQLAELAAWEDVGRGADFLTCPPAGGRSVRRGMPCGPAGRVAASQAAEPSAAED